MKFIASTLFLAASACAFSPSSIIETRPISSFRINAEKGEEVSVEENSAVVETPPAPVAVESATPPMGDCAGVMELKSLAKDLNPIIPFYDPLQLAQQDFYDLGQDATIGFLRHAEIKHGRVAMAAFVGYCVQSNWHWPWAMSLDGSAFPPIDIGPEAQWDAIPASAKWQILIVIGAMEMWDEASGADGEMPHYMNGRQPGKYPTFQKFRDDVHFVFDLYDPFGFSKKMSQEKKDKRLVAEINNGRLAMLGIFGFMSADNIEGSVPLLKSIAIPYAGQIMSPFEAGYGGAAQVAEQVATSL